MKNFLDTIKESGVSELFWIVVGIILGKLVEIIIEFVRTKVRNFKLKKNIETEDRLSIESLDIVSLDHADPVYEMHDISVETVTKRLFIDSPAELKESINSLDKDMTFSSDISFDRESSFTDLVHITGIHDLQERIEKHRKLTAQFFISKLEKGHTIFNGRKYGVYRIHRKRNADPEENACLRLELFETDYFTHQVFRSIYQELKQENHPIGKLTKLENLHAYYPFTTSFGMNTFIILETGNLDEIIFAKRSRFLNTGSLESKWHVTMNEGLTETDREGKDISLIKCMHRGLREELGIREEHHKHIIDERFMDLFIEMGKFEIGLTSYVKMDINKDKLFNLYSAAKDGELETDGLVTVPISEKKLKGFLKDEKLTEAAKYTLKMLLARRKYLG
ncbi:hypothetical protein [Mesobacillus jeotgali]|uniref:hypothetical protein n=1 Tax=Mesobacillus jeotgali TaxID=129985 RepID=UPI000C8638FE|nr:hypothetical protein [Mesobacillus jeotgali]